MIMEASGISIRVILISTPFGVAAGIWISKKAVHLLIIVIKGKENNYMKKKAISFVLAIAMCLSMTSVAFAAEEPNSMQETVSKVATILPLLCGGISDDCYLGEELDAYQITGEGEIETIEYRLYPVFSDEEIVALAQVAENSQGEETVSCITAYAGDLQAYYERNPNEKVAIVFAKDGVYILPEGQFPVQIYTADNIGLGEVVTATDSWNQLSASRIETEVSFVPVASRTRALQFLTLNVEIVPNVGVGCTKADGTGCDDLGLCWAASMAMIVNYFRDTSHTTSSIHTYTGCMSHDTSSSDYKRELRDFGLYVYGAYSTFTYTTIVNLTQGDRLAFMRIERSYVEDNKTKKIGHIIVPYGYFYDPDANSSKYFYYIDPNYGGGIAEFPDSGELLVPTNGVNYYFDYYLECDF